MEKALESRWLLAWVCIFWRNFLVPLFSPRSWQRHALHYEPVHKMRILVEFSYFPISIHISRSEREKIFFIKKVLKHVSSFLYHRSSCFFPQTPHTAPGKVGHNALHRIGNCSAYNFLQSFVYAHHRHEEEVEKAAIANSQNGRARWSPSTMISLSFSDLVLAPLSLCTRLSD